MVTRLYNRLATLWALWSLVRKGLVVRQGDRYYLAGQAPVRR